MRLRDKVAVVTGAGAGLGRAVALEFAAEGAHVVAVSIDKAELAEVTKAATETNGSLRAIAADVASEADTNRVRSEILRDFGKIDILVNNAAIIFVKSLLDTTADDWDRLLDTNLRGPFLYCRAMIPAMERSGGGTVINVSSLAGIRGRAGEVAYTASKFGLEGFSRALAAEVRTAKIRVITIHPGVLIHTAMSMTTYDDEQRTRWVDPSLIAPAFVTIAVRSDMADSGRRFNAWNLVRPKDTADLGIAESLIPAGQEH